MKPKENKSTRLDQAVDTRYYLSGNKSPANSNNDSGLRVSVGNKSAANANHVSGSRGSREQFPKYQLNGKRRN